MLGSTLDAGVGVGLALVVDDTPGDAFGDALGDRL